MKRFTVFAALLMSGCASIASGTSQDITINTTPGGAQCELLRQSTKIAECKTPCTLTVQKSKHDITLQCSKAGYETASVINNSGSEGATWGNVIAGGVIGWGVDSATGADNHYNENMNLTLERK